MRNTCWPYVLLSLGSAALAAPASAATPISALTSSGTCLASPEGFNSNLEPINPGVAWAITFNAVGSADESGNITEVGQSVDTASFGAGPRMHSAAASAYKDAFTSKVAGPNTDGSFTLEIGRLSGAFTAGPNTGLTFTASGFKLTGWMGKNGVSVYGNGESSIIQSFALSNGTRFQRVCSIVTVVTSSLQ